MKKHRTPEQWQTLINQHRNSGLSIKQFCQQHNIVYGLNVWSRDSFGYSQPAKAKSY
ncbi:IS66 family insertion sequence element accessory protein TnpA [Marinospirillum minutulum]|uniref:IS66 family insertion sequence element accessory protein TnpA n=1 Tax=Marinospirillum minutulum TaxID=64974 RepID=UPI003CCBC627